MTWKNGYEKAVKCLDWNAIRRTIATTLILSLLGTQMPLSSAAEFGSSGTGNSGSHSAGNAVPSKMDSSNDDDMDGEEELIISGMITFMDDGTADPSLLDDLDLRLYRNGTLATGSNVEVQLDKDGLITATGSNAVIPLVNDLGSADADGSGRRSGAEDGFLTWNWYVVGLPEADSDGNPYTYSIRDMGYHPDPATSSNASPLDGYALFYTDEGGVVVDPDGEWTADAWNLVYIQKGTIQGDFSNETGAIPLATPTNLNPAPYDADDEDYIGEAAYGWIDMGAGSWYIANALLFNPQTGAGIIWRGQVDEAVSAGWLIRYDNIGEYADYDDSADYIYEGGTIVNCSTTCQVTGTIVWQDSENTYGKRPNLNNFTLEVMDANGESVPDVVIEIEEGNISNTWNYTIAGLSVDGIYKVKASVAGYIEAEEIEFTASAGLSLENIEMLISTPHTVTIKAEVTGLQESESATLTYTFLADGNPYDGSYSYTLYRVDGTTETGTETSHQITIRAGETVVVQLTDTVEDTVVTVDRKIPEDSGVLFLDKTESVVDEMALYVFQYTALKSMEVCIVWNDNNNQYSVRPYETSMEYLDDDKIHLYFQLEGERKYDLSAPDDLAAALARLGLTEWNGFTAAGDGATAEWYYSTAGLPAYILSADGSIAEVKYWIEVEDVDDYVTTDKGFLDSWKFIYTSKTKLEFEVLWLDDNSYNGTRPEVADWKETVTLYQVSTNPGIGEAERTKEIDLSAMTDSFFVMQDGNTWEIEISDLPEYDEDGYPYTYYLVQGEVIPNSDNDILNDIQGDISYEAANSNTGNYSSKTDACYQGGVIKNTLTGELEYSATKIWQDGNREEDQRPTVTLTLWRYTKGDAALNEHSYAAAARVYYDINGEAVTVTLAGDAENGYYVNVSGNLPTFDKDGHEYIYFVRESLSGTASSQYICEIDNSSGGTVEAFSQQMGYDNGNLIFSGGTFTNRLTGKVAVSGTKTWKAKAIQGMTEATITVALQRKLVTEADDAWEQVYDEKSDPVVEDIKDFKAETMTQSFSLGSWDRYDEHGEEYEYRAVETGVTLTIGTSSGKVTNIAYDNEDGSALYEIIIVGGESYSFSSEITTTRTNKSGNDVAVNEEIVNQLTGETVVEIHKYWAKAAYDALGGSVTKLYFHVYQNGKDICEELADDGFVHTQGCLVMDVSDSFGKEETEGIYHWEISLEGLPKYDDEGAEYVYTIGETDADKYAGRVEGWYGDRYHSYNYDHYGADVYNGDGCDGIVVVKEWLDDGDVLHREPVTVAFYDAEEKDYVGNPLTLDKSNVWSGILAIPSGYSAADLVVKEWKIGGNERNNIDSTELEELNLIFNDEKAYIRTDEHIYEITEQKETDGTGTRWVISNLRIGTIDIHLEKQWVAGAMENPEDYSAKFALYKTSSDGKREKHDEQQVLANQNPETNKWEWAADFINLPKYDAAGALYTWSLEEQDYSVPEGDIKGDYSRSPATLNQLLTVYGEYHTGDDYSYTATNTRSATAKVTFHKIWKDNNGKDGVSRPDIYLKLYRAVDVDGDGILNTIERTAAPWLTAQIPAIEKKSDYHWSFSYSSLPKYNSAGVPYIYFAEEGMPAAVSGGWKTVYLDALENPDPTDYDRTISLENSRDERFMLEEGIAVNYREGTTFVNGNKIWANMGTYLDKKYYPYEQITLTLYSEIMDENGVYGEPAPVLDESGTERTTKVSYNDKTGNFTYDFDVALRKYDEETGSLIRYSVRETLEGDDVGGFTWNMNGIDFGLTNTYDGGKTLSLRVYKEWDFGAAVNDSNAEQPVSGYPGVTFTLYRKLQKYENGSYSDLYTDRVETVKGPITLNRATGYVEFSNLPYYGANGHPYRYYIRENSISGYNITVKVASESNTYTSTNSVVDLKEKLHEGENTVTFTNVYNEEKVTITGTKTWKADSGWNTRPDDIELTLYRQGSTLPKEEVIADVNWDKTTDSWEFTFVGTEQQPLYRYATNGEEYIYTVEETSVAGYKNPVITSSSTGATVTPKKVTVAITNTLNTIDLKVTKLWLDNNNRYGTRPENITVMLQRRTDDSGFDDVMNPQAPQSKWMKTITGSDTTDADWTITFSGLPKYAVTTDADGKVITKEYEYQAIEVNTDGGYASASNAVSGTTTITNTLESCDLTVRKVWDDNDDQDGIRPSEVVVALYQTTTEGDIENGSRVSENINGSVTDEFTLNGLSYTWSGLPQKSPEGLTYYYYVVEAGTSVEPLARYSVAYSSASYEDETPQEVPVAVIPATGEGAAATVITITNTYAPKEMSVTVEKAWVGADGETVLTNEDILPATITWQLQRRFQGNREWTDVEAGGSQTVLPGTDHKYIASWSNLPVKEKDASSGTSRVIEYRVSEFEVSGYETIYPDSDSGVSGDITKPVDENQKTITVTNRLTATTKVKVAKIWRDDLPGYNRQDELYSITFKLQRKFADSSDDFADVSETDGLAGGFVVTKTMLVPGSDTHHQYDVFADLPRYDQTGKEYAYRAVEAGFTLTSEYGGGYVEAVYNNSLSESGTLGGYTVRGIYTAAADGEVTDTATGSNAWIANTLSHRKVAVEKVWEDADNQDGVRPTAVKVELLHDGDSYEPAKTATLSNATEWKHEWKNLPANHADGTPFEYSVVEIAMEGLDEVQWGANNGYETSYSGISTSEDQPLTVINSRTPETINYTVYKYWDDSNEYDWSAERPDSVQVQLYRQVNGGAITEVENGRVTLYAEARDGHDAWTYTWTELPKYAREGEVETEVGDSYVIRYTVKEVIPEDGSGYEAVIDGNQIMNQLLTTELTVIKEWEDQSNYYERRPETITIQLQRSTNGTTWNNVDGVSQELNAQDSSQSCTFIGLPVRDKNNRPYQYRALETYLDDVKVVNNAASGYKVAYEHDPNYETASGASEPGETVITNTLETVALSGKKTWEDHGNFYGTRPERIRLTLKSSPADALAEGLLEALVPEWSKNGNIWTYTYTGLPKYMADGKTLIVYSVVETVDAGAVYKVAYDAAHTNLTNTMQTGSLAVTKIQERGYATDFTFRVKLNINGVETLYTGAYTVLESGAAWNEAGEVRQTDESGAIVIRRRQQFVITGLPAGAAYTVTEDPMNRYTLASTVDDTGVIPYQKAAAASFTNKYTSSGGGGGGGGGTTPTQPGTEAPTEPATEGTAPTVPEPPTTSGDNGLVEIPGDPPSVIVTDPNGNTIYEGPTDDGYLDTSGWPSGTYTIYLLDEEGVPLGQMQVTIADNETPLAGLAKTGDTSLPRALIIAIMLGTVGGMTALVLKRRKEEE